MKIRRGLSLVLPLTCLLLIGFHSQTVWAITPEQATAIQEKLKNVLSELRTLEGNPNSTFSTKISSAVNKIRSAQALLKTVEDSQPEDSTTRTAASDAASKISDALKELDGAQTSRPETKQTVENVVAGLKAILPSFSGAPEGAGAAPAATQSASPRNSVSFEEGDGFLTTISSYLAPALQIFAVVLTLVLLTYSVMMWSGMRRLAGEHFEGSLPRAFAAVKGRQDDLARQFENYAGAGRDINQRLQEMHAEIRQISRTITLNQQNQQRAIQSSSNELPAPEDEMPQFPISAEDLLRRMQRKSVIVKRDFQNDMLVTDPDGKGEFILLRDSQIPEEQQPLLIVPRVTQFQMQQEYYNFYEKYFDCARPESGALWIVEPAVVENVAGGWQLREKGRLEVR